jgi:Cof subfamily protein (haloacid dehalogenase superfamily)
VVSDLDGTLLDQIDSLSPNYIDELNKMIDQGLKFTIATGRDMKKAKKAIQGLKLKYPVILTNGALLGDLNKEEYLKITWITPEIVDAIMKRAAELAIPPMVFAAFDPITKTMHFNKGKWGLKGIVPLPPERYKPFQHMQIVSIQFHTRKEILDPFMQWIRESYGNRINLIYIEDVGYRNETNEDGWYWLEINSADAGKEKMLRTLADITGHRIEDTVVFGDNTNDIGILRMAGKAITVANAPEEVRQVASAVCGSNREGGVIKYLQEHYHEFL